LGASDGICAEVCPENILEMADGKAARVEAHADACMPLIACPTLAHLGRRDFESDSMNV